MYFYRYWNREEYIVKLLDLHIDKNLTCTNHVETLCKNAER